MHVVRCHFEEVGSAISIDTDYLIKLSIFPLEKKCYAKKTVYAIWCLLQGYDPGIMKRVEFT